MLGRLAGAGIRPLARQLVQSRFIVLTRPALGGGHHDLPNPEPHVPQPLRHVEKDFFGRPQHPRITKDSHDHTGDDYASYVGAGVFVLLTVGAIALYTDVFGMNIKEGFLHAHHRPFTPAKETKSKPPPTEPESKPQPAAPQVKEEQPELAAAKVSAKEAPVVPLSKKADAVKQGHDKESTTTPSASSSDEPSIVEKIADAAKEEVRHVKELASEAVASVEAAVEKAAHKVDEALTLKSEEVEAEGPEIPDYIPYLLVGSGAAAYYASLTIRARDAEAKVLMIGSEPELPYNKPPLSKELWWYSDENARQTLTYKGLSGKMRDIYFESKGFYVPVNEIAKAKHGGVSLLKGVTVTKICPKEKKVVLEDGRSIRFGKCLLATGGQPKRLPVFEPVEKSDSVMYLKDVADYRRIDEACERGGTISVVGGGFLGSELAYSIKRRYPKTRVVQIIQESGPLSGVLPNYLSAHTRGGLERSGVEVHTDSSIIAATKKSGEKLSLSLNDGRTISTDYVVVAVGSEPNVILASNDVHVDESLGGFLADAQLRVAPGIWCAGDSCAYDAGVLGRRRIEHWENAQITGRLAGENMTDGNRDFWFQSSYFTKVGPEMHINAVGDTDSKLNTVSIFADQEEGFPNKYHKGVVFYENGGKIVGCLLVNVFGAGLDIARRMIDEKRSVADAKELSKLYALWEQENSEEIKAEVKK